MFNVGGPEVMVILIVALVVLGPQQLPKAMRTFGSVMSEVRKVSNGFQAEMRAALDAADQPDEKPQSGSMAAQTPRSTQAAEIDEVVARNPSVDDGTTATGDATDATDANGEEAVVPAIDPADRAAG